MPAFFFLRSSNQTTFSDIKNKLFIHISSTLWETTLCTTLLITTKHLILVRNLSIRVVINPQLQSLTHLSTRRIILVSVIQTSRNIEICSFKQSSIIIPYHAFIIPNNHAFVISTSVSLMPRSAFLKPPLQLVVETYPWQRKRL